MEEAITKKSNFYGTDIDTIKASHTQFSSQADQNLPHNATTTNGDGDNQSLYPRDSVGPPFTPPLPVNDDFRTAMRGSEIQKNFKPLGLPSPNLLLCYQNAVLTTLINSDTFISYARWHRKNEPNHCMEHIKFKGSRTLRALATMATRNESPEDHMVKQERFEAIVNAFWKTHGFPWNFSDALTQETAVGPWSRYGGGKREDEQQDAGEFLLWLFRTIDDQLGIHHDWDDTREHKSQKTSAQRNFDWFSSLNRTTRLGCPRCTWRVQLRSRVEYDRPLVLNIPNRSHQKPPIKLQDCVSRSFRESISDEWRCPRCKERDTGGYKLSTIQHAPNVLMILLQRTLKKQGKELRAVEIPEHLNLSPWLNHHQYGPGSKVSYRLSGVVSHQGGDVRSGHYHSYVRGGAARDQWFRLNDEIVTRLDSMSSFDDTGASKLSASDFKERFTPLLMLYKKEPEKEVVVPAVNVVNADEGADADVRPTRWTGLIGKDTVDDQVGISPSSSSLSSAPSTLDKDSPASSNDQSQSGNDRSESDNNASSSDSDQSAVDNDSSALDQTPSSSSTSSSSSSSSSILIVRKFNS